MLERMLVVLSALKPAECRRTRCSKVQAQAGSAVGYAAQATARSGGAGAQSAWAALTCAYSARSGHRHAKGCGLCNARAQGVQQEQGQAALARHVCVLAVHGLDPGGRKAVASRAKGALSQLQGLLSGHGARRVLNCSHCCGILHSRLAVSGWHAAGRCDISTQTVLSRG